MSIALCARSAAVSAAFLSILGSLLGCTPSFQGEPARVYSVSEQIQFVRQTFGPPRFVDYFKLTPSEMRAYRNEYVLAQMYAIDVNYGVYEASLTREMQSVNFAATVTNIALTTVASQISPPGTKDILTATAAALSGAKAAYDKDILIARTIQIIQSQMRASRAKVAKRIVQNLGKPALEYPLMMAWIDLQSYYKAGTLTDGLVEAGQSIGADAIAAGEAFDSVVVYGLPADDPTVILFTNFLFPKGLGTPRDEARLSYLRSLLDGYDGNVLDFIPGPPEPKEKHADARILLIECIKVYGTSAQCAPKSIRIP